MELNNIRIEGTGRMMTMKYALLPSDVIDDAALERVKTNLPEGIIPVQVMDISGVRSLFAQFAGGTTLKSYMKMVLDKGAVLGLLKNLITCMGIGKLGIPVSYIAKKSDFIFVDPQTLKTSCFVIPVKGEINDSNEVRRFLRSMVSRMKFSENDSDNYVAKLLTVLNSDRFSLNEFNVLVNEMLVEMGDALISEAPVGSAKVDKMGVIRNRASITTPPAGQPQFNGQPQFGAQPQFNGQPQFEAQPQFGTQPQFGAEPQFNGQPQFGAQPQFEAQPQFNSQPQAESQPVMRFDPMTGQPLMNNAETPEVSAPDVNAMAPQTETPVNPEPSMTEETAAAESSNTEEVSAVESSNVEEVSATESSNTEEVSATESSNTEERSVTETSKPEETPAMDTQKPEENPVTETPISEEAAKADASESSETAIPELVAESSVTPEMETKEASPQAEVPATETSDKKEEAPETEKSKETSQPAVDSHVLEDTPVTPIPEMQPQTPTMMPGFEIPTQINRTYEETTNTDIPKFEVPSPEEISRYNSGVDNGAVQGQPVKRFDPMTGQPIAPADNPFAGQPPMGTPVAGQPAMNNPFAVEPPMGTPFAGQPPMGTPVGTPFAGPVPSAMPDPMLPRPHFVREKTGEKIFIDKEEFRIGKSKLHADYAIENNTAISRVHVVIIKRNGVSYLKDNDSTNGTWIDGERLEPGREVLLKANMKVKFGDEDFTFYLREGV